jgi:GNAT superfamily N-acetyltransferase
MSLVVSTEAAARRLVRRAADGPHARLLTSALRAEQTANYGFADPLDPDPRAYTPPAGLFLVSYCYERPTACGGYRVPPGSTGTAEIRKMYTVPAWRRRGLGRAVLEALEDHARSVGIEQMLLETGVHNAGALALYETLGYRPIDSYVPGRSPEINRAFAKQLA